MKPAPFLYAAPDGLEEALALLEAHGTSAKVLAGGQSLVPLMNLRLARPGVVVDLNRVPGLDAVETRDGWLCIGALTRQRTLETSSTLASASPLLAEAASLVGHPAIRSRGTLGGSLAHADPAAELPAAALALDAEIAVRSRLGERVIPAAGFFQGPFTTAVGPTEVVGEIRIPRRPGPSGSAFLEVARRHGDFALAGVACAVWFSAEGVIQAAGIALAGVGPTPVRARGAEGVLRGQRPTRRLFAEAGRAAAGAAEPTSDIHATAGYRRRLTGVLTERALLLASARAGMEAA